MSNQTDNNKQKKSILKAKEVNLLPLPLTFVSSLDTSTNDFWGKGAFVLRKLRLFIFIPCIFLSGCIVRIGNTGTAEIASTVQLSQAFSKELSYEWESLDELHMDFPITKENFSFVETDDSKIKVTFHLISSNEYQLQSYIDEIILNQVVDMVSLSQEGIIPCTLLEIQGVTYIHGLCIEKVEIAIPKTTNLQVWLQTKWINFKATPDFTHMNQKVVNELINASLALSFDSSRIEMLRGLSLEIKEERFITVRELIRLIQTMSHTTTYFEVIELFSGRIIDTENAYLITDLFELDEDRLNAYEWIRK
ncbi:MAG: hypothetical protein CL678_03485 [Bdellovibrionaceae bacterium]|nr:hypothetical protein [Pseudobdellovibrionaceae bacterium]